MVKELESSTCSIANSNEEAAGGDIFESGQAETTSDAEMEDDNRFGTTHSVPEADAFVVDPDVDLDSRFLLDMLSADGLASYSSLAQRALAQLLEGRTRCPTGTFDICSPVISFFTLLKMFFACY